MARLILPDKATPLHELAGKVIAKDTADGAASIIRPFMDENDMVLADMQTDLAAAMVLDTERTDLKGSAEKLFKDRNNDWKFPWTITQKAAQNLKKFYFQNPANLNLWGIPITVDGRINFPVEFLERTEIFKAIKAKHETYSPASASPLNVFLVNNNISLTDMDALVDSAITAHNSGTDFNEQSETKTVAMHLKMDPNAEKLGKLGYFLMSSFPQNPHTANDWGYKVDDVARKTTVQKTTILPLGEKGISNVVLGGELKNDSAATLHIFKGTTTTGVPVVVGPNARWVPTKGYSVIKILNTSDTITATIYTQAYR